MDELAHGWAIITGQGHGVAIMLALLIVILVAVALGMWAAMRAARRRDRNADMSPLSRTPAQRRPLPGPDRGFRPD
jgi:hypothetical protein